jgi:hypothetical protein
MKLILKILFLFAGALVFFLLFPFFQRYGAPAFAVFCALLTGAGTAFRIVAGRKEFRVTMILWLTGSVIYMMIALVLILRRVQPLPYVWMEASTMTLYYASYPLRVLGVFFVGLIFVHITSPVEFLAWGGFGLKAALAYRAFEYSMNAFDDTRRSLILQGYWPDPTARRNAKRSGKRAFLSMIENSPVLIATTFRNIILWFPWAWICYNSLMREVKRSSHKEAIK